MIADGQLWVLNLEEQVPHGDEGQRIIVVDCDGLLDEVGAALLVIKVHVDDSQLRESLVVRWIKCDNFLVILHGRIGILREVLQGHAEAIVGGNGVSVNLDSVFEVLKSSLAFPLI